MKTSSRHLNPLRSAILACVVGCAVLLLNPSAWGVYEANVAKGDPGFSQTTGSDGHGGYVENIYFDDGNGKKLVETKKYSHGHGFSSRDRVPQYHWYTVVESNGTLTTVAFHYVTGTDKIRSGTKQTTDKNGGITTYRYDSDDSEHRWKYVSYTAPKSVSPPVKSAAAPGPTGGQQDQLAGYRCMNLNEPFNIISVGCVLGGGNSGSTTDHFTTTTTDVSTTRTVNVDIPGIPGLTPEKVTTTMPVTQTMHTSTDNGLGNGFNGGGILAFDHFFGPCGPDGAWGIGTAALVLRGNNDTEVIPEINLNFLHQFPGNNQVIVNAGVAVPLASHFADGCGDVGARVIHCFSPEWGGFIGVQGIFGGNTSLGECIFGITLTPGQTQQGGSVTVEQARALHRQDSDFWSHGVDTGMELRY